MRRIMPAFVVCLLIAAQPASDPSKNDLAAMQGSWMMVSGERDGQPMPEEFVKQFKRVCKDNETTVTMGDQVYIKTKFTLDASKDPKTIDYDVPEGPDKGKKQLGIYDLNGDTLRFCFSAVGKERPKAFKGADGVTLSVWKREKK